MEETVDFKDRHVMVTGSTGALGTTVVGALLEAGAVCHVPYRTPAQADHPLRGHPRLVLCASDSLAVERSVSALYGSLPELWASVHIAGAFSFGNIADTDMTDLDRMIEANFVSAFLCCRAAVAVMRRQGGGGRIVNVSARPGLEWRLGAGMAAYAATKAAVAALTVALAEEVVKDGILVNAVAPSIIDTPANRRDMLKADHLAWPTPEDIATTILFLASADNTAARGSIVPVYGRT
jgi:NAD(P)-dependent dehydrogenase (short-subunit alcohol dehydrogenase family)